MNLVLELSEIEKQVSALISENINLKKENKELTEQNTSLLTSVENLNKSVQELEQKLEQTEKDLADYQFNYPTIKELQKENADLKEEINKIAFARGNLEEENAELKEKVNILDNCDRLGDVITEAYKDQLTKAKEIIKTFCGFCSVFNSTNGSFDNLIAEAEQFLSEVEI